MKRLVYNSKTCSFVWSDWFRSVVDDYGLSCVKKNKYVEDKVRINNNEVSTGSSRTALYTMPGGVDTGVRYAALYDSSGLDITEIEATKNALKQAEAQVKDKIREEFDKISTETADKISQTSSNNNTSSSSNSE